MNSSIVSQTVLSMNNKLNSVVKSTLTFPIIFILMLSFVSTAWAKPQGVNGTWYSVSKAAWSYQGQSQLVDSSLKPVTGVSLTGGEFWFQGDFDLEESGRYVLDFKNTSIIGHFHHYVFDENYRLVATMEGGSQSHADNPFYLRHGRELELPPGRYRLITSLSSPFYLAQPDPYINNLADYRSSIKGGNTLVMAGLGIFLGLGIYYAALSLSRRRLAEGMYTLFIIGNLVYNSTGLLVMPQLFDIHWFYMSSTPILFSNMAYIMFVMALLGIRRGSHPRLYAAGIIMLTVMAVFIIFAAFFPNWSMEFARYGVGLFLSYGLTSGIIRARQGYVTAKLYLIAIGTFFVFGGIAISQSQLSGVYTYQLEHLGLFAVAVETILLALVLSYQFAQLQREKESIFSDFTEERIRGEELAKAKAEAERANKAKSEFLSSMSHELRTPMNAILGFAQLMHYDDNLPKEYTNGVYQILKAGNHLLDLINEVLDLAKVESGRIEMSLEQVEVGHVVDECLRLVKTIADKRNIQLLCSYIEDTVVRADRTRLKQVLINLLSNAIKYNRESGQVVIDIRPEGEDRVRILVTDTGYGVAEERFAEIFQPFNRLDAEYGEIEGTGIGLTLSRTLVELMGGKVGVESTVGKGSVFWIELPHETLSEYGHEEAETRENIHQAQHQVVGVQTVLYIEDNPANLSLMEQILSKRKNISLLSAHTPALGIELASSHQPNLILLDINMPGMNGYQVLKQLKEHPEVADTPVIALTASAMPRDIKRGVAAGFTDYLTKPLDVLKLLQILDQYLLVFSEDES